MTLDSACTRPAAGGKPGAGRSGRPRILVFVPSYNDTVRVAEIENALSTGDGEYRILVVDDGSEGEIVLPDPTHGTLYARLPDNCGLGLCTRIAFTHALNHDYDVILRIDADGQHPLDSLPALLEPVVQDRADMVVGSRANRNDGTGALAFFARLARGYYALAARVVTGGRVPSDVNSGLFAVNRIGMRHLNAPFLERFPEPEMYVRAGRSGMRVGEVEVEQLERRTGRSALNVSAALRAFFRFNVFLLEELSRRSR